MMRKNIPSGSPYEQSIGFSRAVRVGEHVVVSGTAPLADDGSTVAPGDLYRQTKRCLEIVVAALADAGAGIADVVRTRVLLVDISRWEEAGRAHGEVFGTVRPACTFVEVKGFIDPQWLVEIEAEATCQLPAFALR